MVSPALNLNVGTDNISDNTPYSGGRLLPTIKGAMNIFAGFGGTLVLSPIIHYFEFKSVNFIKNNNYCISLQLPNILIDNFTFTRDPDLPYSRVIEGVSQAILSPMPEWFSVMVVSTLNELAVAPLHLAIRRAQMKFFKNEESFFATTTRIAIASLIIGVANYQTALDWDTRHHSNYLNGLTSKTYVDELVCEQQSTLDARVASAFFLAFAHGIVYELFKSLRISITVNYGVQGFFHLFKH